MPEFEEFVPKLTADGSFTFVSQEFDEAFHSHFGAKQESFLKFVSPTQLATSAYKPVLRLLDVCYGLGYNTAAALQTIWSVNPDCRVEIFGLEINPLVPQAAIAHHLFDNWSYECVEVLTQLAYEHHLKTDRLQATLLIGDARNSIRQLIQSNFQADAIFLDPFSPPQCPQLWTVEFIQQLSLCLHRDGLLATYSCAAAVRMALMAAGLQIGSTPPVGRRTPGTVAAHLTEAAKCENGTIEELLANLAFFPHPPLNPSSSLSQAEKEHLLTRAAIPYRDPHLSDPAQIIIMRRRQEQDTCLLEPTSHWRKRWALLS